VLLTLDGVLLVLEHVLHLPPPFHQLFENLDAKKVRSGVNRQSTCKTSMFDMESGRGHLPHCSTVVLRNCNQTGPRIARTVSEAR
jgi:hypothetical protein